MIYRASLTDAETVAALALRMWDSHTLAELATYGLVSGMLYHKLPRKKGSVYAALLTAMVAGRLVWGVARFLCAGLDVTAFGLSAFWVGAVTTAIPGIIVQIILIPILVLALEKYNPAKK